MSQPFFDPDCAFCAIARGFSRVDLVAEGRAWLAFTPLEPATPGHTLVIPRTHVPDLWDGDAALASILIDASIRVGRAIRSALNPDGMNLITSDGSAAEQTIFHLHLHLVPRWENDEFGPIWPTGHRHQDDKQENVAGRIREAFASVPYDEPDLD